MTHRMHTRYTKEQRFVCQYTGRRARSKLGVAYAEGVNASGKPCYYIVDQTAGYTAWTKSKVIERRDLSQEDIGLSGVEFRNYNTNKDLYALHINTGCVFAVPRDKPDKKGTVMCYSPEGIPGRLALHLLEWITKDEYEEWAKIVPKPLEGPDTTGWRICKDCGKPIDPFKDGGHFYCALCIAKRRQEAEFKPDTEWMTGDEYAPYPQKTKRESAFDRKDNIY